MVDSTRLVQFRKAAPSTRPAGSSPNRRLGGALLPMGGVVDFPFTPAALFRESVGAWYDPSSLWGAADHLPRRNLLTNTGFAGVVAGTPGTAPTGWVFTFNGGTTAVSGETLTLSTAGAARQFIAWNTLITLLPGVSYTLGIEITAASGNAADTLVAFTPASGSVTGTTVLTVADGTGRKSLIMTSAAGATGYVRIGAGVSVNTVGAASVSFKEPMFATTATLDQSYQKVTDWATELYAHAAAKNVPWLRRNRFLSTATLSTQTVSAVTATPLTVSFTGTGTITFSTAYVGTLVGTGASYRVTATFTPAAGNLVCTVTGSVTLAQCEVGSAATDYQAIGASWEATFAANAAAAGVTPTMYTDSAGTTPVTGPDSVVGFQGDLARGYAQSELCANGTFANETGWTLIDETVTISGGTLNFASTTNRFARFDLPITKVATYLVTFTVTSYTSGAPYVAIGIGTVVNVPTGVGSKSIVVTSATTDAGFRLYAGAFSVGGVFSIDNLSIRELPGYHAIQSGATGLKPTLRLNSNGYWYIQRDLSDDALVTTFPNLGANCVSYINDGATVTETTGVTLNGALTQSTPAADYGRIYLNAPSSKSAQIIKWLKAKAGL